MSPPPAEVLLPATSPRAARSLSTGQHRRGGSRGGSAGTNGSAGQHRQGGGGGESNGSVGSHGTVGQHRKGWCGSNGGSSGSNGGYSNGSSSSTSPFHQLGVNPALSPRGSPRGPRTPQGTTTTRPFARRSPRHAGAVICTFTLGILALAPLLGPFRGGLSTTGRRTDPAGAFRRRQDHDSYGTGADTAQSLGQSGTTAGGEKMFLSPEELAGELLQDGRPRCAEDEEGESRCLPTVFFIGVSKCGTTSLSNWLSRHPRARLVSAQEGYNFFEAHLFDNSPKLWHDTKIAARRARLATLAQHEDTVVDFTPHYSVVAEAPHRIADLYGEGTLKRKGLRFLIVLREPVARTISSWEYKSELSSNETVADATVSPEPGLAALPPPPPLAAAVDATADAAAGAEGAEVVVAEAKAVRARRKLKLVEDRTLPMVLEEGAERVERLSECFKDAADNGLFGREPEVTSCRDSKGPKQCEGNPPCQICNTHTEPWCNPRDYLEEVMFNAHVGKSVYVMQLQRWFNVFGRESFKVVFTEDMAENPLETLTEVLEFLGLDMLDAQGHKGLRSLEEWKDIVGARYNTADRAKKEKLDAQVTPEVVQSMREFFGPYNKALEDLLGRRLPDAWGVAREG